ncbi:MAG: single-stranded-DNA-specific exonuclease RecJ [Paludibacteraceae bacterium]|nr:single-stranded-DNA-specific exonuclease RecJ [Paludibacteraceae bacterium]
MNYNWNIRRLTAQEEALQQQLERELNISSAAARMLVVRNIQSAEEARQFIRPSLDKLHNPFLMKDMDKAVERLHQAVTQGEKILIYGDYDVDGTTAVAVMYRFLEGIIDNGFNSETSNNQYPIGGTASNIDYYIPDRYTEGYGVSTQGIDYAVAHGCSLIITLDCGIKAVEKVAYAKSKGIDVIVCDHHTPGDELPKAVAVLNMKREDCPYPYKDLSGCGVGFKLAQAYTQQYSLPFDNLVPLLQLLAMSIASDIVPITGENRILAHYGIKQINQAPFTGISAVINVAGIEAKKLTINELVYKLGPRINACGRMKSGRAAVELLLTDDATFARQQAEEVNQHNEERRDCDTETTKEALAMLEEDTSFAQRRSTVVYAPHWHKGVVGIVASRLTETYYRPTIVLTAGEDGIISGSARSVGGFDIYAAIDSCLDLLTNFGGHKYAAGLSMHIDNLPAFCERFEHYVATHIREDQLQPTLLVEAELELADITPAFYNVIRYLEPFGPGNPRPLFATRNLINHRDTRVVGKTGEHLRLDVTDRAYAITGIAFGRADMAQHIQNGNAVDICYELDENTFNNRTSIQMMAQDIKPS